jgi:hypothetical protein
VGSFDTLLEYVHLVASTLRHLTIMGCVHNGLQFLDYTAPLTTLVEFNCLRVFEAAHDSLIATGSNAVDTILPPSLELSSYLIHISASFLSWDNFRCSNPNFPDSKMSSSSQVAIEATAMKKLSTDTTALGTRWLR